MATATVMETAGKFTAPVRSEPDLLASKLARLSGFLYLISLPTLGVPFGVGQFLTSGDPRAALARIEAHLPLFRLVTVISVIGFIDYLLLALVLYKLLHQAGKTAATAMLALVAVSVPVSLSAVARWMDVLAFLGNPDRVGSEVLQGQIMIALRGYNSLISISAIFWGLWLIPFGWLVLRSGIMPRVIGILLMLGSVFYVASFVGTIFDPGYASTLTARIIGFASGLPSTVGGELAACLWLLIAGARHRH